MWKYITKPFRVEDLASEIQRTLKREADGGTLHDVSSGMFLQLIEMEQKTCTIRIADSRNQKQGVLYFRDGDLLDARINGLKGEKAAHEIFSWDEVTLSIQNGCPLTEKRIQGELQAILLEAMRLKDEAKQTAHVSTGPEEVADSEKRQENLTPPHRADGPAETRRDGSLKEISRVLGLDSISKGQHVGWAAGPDGENRHVLRRREIETVLHQPGGTQRLYPSAQKRDHALFRKPQIPERKDHEKTLRGR